MSKIFELADTLNNTLIEINKTVAEVNQDLSKIDQEISDIYHFIEFSNLSASEGYKAYKMLQDCLKKRRAIKNEQNYVRQLNIACDKLRKNETLFIDKVLNRSWTPNIRGDLSIGEICKIGMKDKNDKVIEIFDSPTEASNYIEKVTNQKFSSKIKRKTARKIEETARINGTYYDFKWTIM